jgi:hypothetical protein
MLDALTQHPLLTEGVAEATAAVAVELIGQREDLLRAGRNGSRPDTVNVLPIGRHDRGDHPAEGLRGAGWCAILALVGNHHHGVADPYLGVDQLTIWAREPLTHLDRPERVAVEVDRSGAVANHKARSDGVQMAGNGADGSSLITRHGTLLWS